MNSNGGQNAETADFNLSQGAAYGACSGSVDCVGAADGGGVLGGERCRRDGRRTETVSRRRVTPVHARRTGPSGRSEKASLWKVPDHATQVLMDRFYDNLWNKKLGKLDSLMEAQALAAARGREGSRPAPRRTRPGIPCQPRQPLREIRPAAAPLLGRLRAFRRLAIGATIDHLGHFLTELWRVDDVLRIT